MRPLLPLLTFALACGAATTPAETTPDPVAADPSLPWSRAEAPPLAIETDVIALVGAEVRDGAGHTFAPGVVIFDDGRLVAVGAQDDVAIPEGATTIDASAKVITPGIIDTHSHMGVYPQPRARAHSDGNEATSPTTPEVYAGDSFWPQDPALTRALQAGVTTIQVLPGSANLIGGRGATLKMHLGRTLREMRFWGAPDTLKMACGENPKRVYGRRNSSPSTRMGNVAGYRAAYQAAREYGQSLADWQHNHRLWQIKRATFERETEAREERRENGEALGDRPDDPGPAPTPPTRDLAKETLWSVIEGNTLVQMHCYRADEMANMLDVAREFGFSIRSFHHAVEAYKIRDLLHAENVSVSTWTDWWGFKLEAYDAIEENIALLHEEGVRVALHSDSPNLIQRLNQEAAKAMAAGRRAGIAISEHDALSWITRQPAWVLGIDELTGTLEAGKMADVVVWSGSPFSVYTHVEQVYVDGLLRFDHRDGVARGGATDFELGQNETESF